MVARSIRGMDTAAADLHTHSDVSDGTRPPGDVVREAARAGLAAVALTDHDTALGWGEASAAALEEGIALLRGMEISATAGVTVHLLAYLPDPDHPGLARALRLARDSRVTRARRMVEALSVDLPLSWDDVLAQAGADATIGRPHIADALVAAGVVPDRTAAFAHLLHRDGPYYTSYWAPGHVEAVELVLAAGGVPVIAHPFATVRGRVLSDAAITQMVEAGLAGIEVDHRDHSPAERERAARLARRHGLLRTGSSDYHGAGKPNRLGENTTSLDVVREIVARGRVPLVGHLPG